MGGGHYVSRKCSLISSLPDFIFINLSLILFLRNWICKKKTFKYAFALKTINGNKQDVYDNNLHSCRHLPTLQGFVQKRPLPGGIRGALQQDSDL